MMKDNCKVYICCLILVLKFNLSFAQIQFEWARNFPWKDAGSSFIGLTGDGQENVVYASNYIDTFTYNGIFHQSAGSEDLVLTKLNSAGVIQWVKTAEGNGEEEIRNACTDSQGNIYITGRLNDTAYFDGDTVLNNSIQEGFFLAKYDANGNKLWIRKCAGGYSSLGHIVKCDHNDNVIVGGSVYGWVMIDTFTVSFINPTDGGSFLVKYDSNGNFMWLRGAKSIYINDIGITAQNEVLAYGDSRITTSYWGNTQQGFVTLYGFGSTDTDDCLIKTGPSGNFIWMKNQGGTGEVYGQKIVVFPDGKYATSGKYDHSAVIAGESLTAPGLSNVYFTSFYDSSGTGIWVKEVIPNPSTIFNFVEVYPAGDSILTKLSYSTAGSCQYSGFNFNSSSYYYVNLGFCDTTGNYAPFLRDSMDNVSTYGIYGLYYSPGVATHIRGIINNYHVFNTTDSLYTTNNFGNGFVAKLVNNNPTSFVTDISNVDNITVYPNPSSDYIYVQAGSATGRLHIDIYNIEGQKINEVNLINRGSVSLPENQGIYILDITSGITRVKQKVVKL